MVKRSSSKSSSDTVSTGTFVLRAALGELLATFLVGFIALPGLAIASGTPAGPSLLTYGFGYAAAIFAVSAVFAKYGAAHLAFHITFVSFLCDSDREEGESFSPKVIWSHVAILVAQNLGWFLSTLFWWSVLPVAFPFVAVTTAVPASVFSHLLQGVVQLFVITLVDHVFIFSDKAYNGLWGALANSLLIGMAIANFGAITGGSFNLERTLYPMLFEGNSADTAIGWFAVAEVVAPLLTCFLYTFIFFERKTKMY